MTECVFCKIVKGEIPARRVFEDDDVIAFDDVNPVAPMHVLIVPRRHIATLNDLTESDAAMIGKLALCASHVARERGLAEKGYRTVINCMSGAGQAVYHVHMHLLGGRVFGWPPG